MKKNPDISGVGSPRKQLVQLKKRLDRVSLSWTLDNYEALVHFYVRIMPKLMEAERCTIYIIEMGTHKIYSMYGTGLEGQKIEPPKKGSIVGTVMMTGKGVINNDLNKRNGYHKQVDAGTGFVSVNTVCVPIKSITGHGVTGAVQVLNKKDKAGFDTQDMELLIEAANYLSMSIENIIVNQEILRVSSQINREVERIDKEYYYDSHFIAKSPAMLGVIDLVRTISASPVSVLLQGENGTGKELVAKMIHNGGDQREGPFVAVNCASIPEHLMESEFFGYEKGAFTGADHRRKGLFEEAQGGTLFLDEVADMPLVMQPKFLRAIQEGEGVRLGSNEIIKYDFRLISASNKKLRKEVDEGRFREDLFFRLFSVEIGIPPLRERKEDIIPLAQEFLSETCTRFKKSLLGFSPNILKSFERYNWPGNVRQLQREVERLVALTPENEMIIIDNCSEDLHESLRSEKQYIAEDSDASMPDQVRLLEIRMIQRTLAKTKGNILKAAESLGITRQGLHKKMIRYEINRKDYS